MFATIRFRETSSTSVVREFSTRGEKRERANVSKSSWLKVKGKFGSKEAGRASAASLPTVDSWAWDSSSVSEGGGASSVGAGAWARSSLAMAVRVREKLFRMASVTAPL